MSKSSKVCAFVLTLLIFITVARTTYSQGSGCHTATSADEAQGWPKGAQVCSRDEKAGISQDAGEAKKYLKSILCPGGSYGGAGPDGTVDKLNPSFAQCSATFLKAEKQKMPELCLNEGYRTVGTQNQYANNYRNGGGIACTQGANCEHPKGIAIDVNASNYQQLWDDAHTYGLVFYLRDRDKVHFVPIAHKQGKTSGPCLTENYNPSSGQFGPNDGVGGGGAPSSGASNDLRNALNNEEKGDGSGGGSPGGGSPGGGSPGGGQPSGGGQTESGNQQPSGNQSPQTNNQPFSSDNNVSSQPKTISNLLNDALNSPQSSTSTLNLVSQFINGTSSESVSVGNTASTTISVSLISSDISYLDASTSDTSTILRQVLDTQNINAGDPSFASPSTFSGSNGQPSRFSGYSSDDPYSLVATIARLKELLISIISYLQPFQGNIPNQQYEA